MLQKTNSSLIVIFDVSFTEKFEVIERYIVEEEIPFISSLNQDNLVRFEWYFSQGVVKHGGVQIMKTMNVQPLLTVV